MNEYALKLQADALQYVVQCLENGPFRLSSPIISTIMEQVRKQDADRAAGAVESL